MYICVAAFAAARCAHGNKRLPKDMLCTVWGGRLGKRFCNMFSESSTFLGVNSIDIKNLGPVFGPIFGPILPVRQFCHAHRSKQCTLAAQSYKWYGMDAQDVLIVKIPIIRRLYWPLLRY